MFKRLGSLVSAAIAGAAVLGFAQSAHALTINTATNQIETSGNGAIFIRFDMSRAGNSSDVVAPDFGGAVVFNNKSAAKGTIFRLGSLAAGEVLEFQLNNLTSGISYFTGLASDNPDNVVHALLTQNADGSITVGFEDLFNGGDMDFNDVIFTVFETPVPGAAVLLLTGLAGFGATRMRKQRA